MSDEDVSDAPDASRHPPLLSPGKRLAVKRSSDVGRSYIYVTFLFPAFAGFLFGYDIGAASGAVGSIEKLSSIGALSSTQRSLLTSASLIGATAGSILALFVGEVLGRRRELMAGGLLYVAGTLLSISAPSGPASRLLAAVLGGRFAYGVGIALCMNAAPLYIAEISPAEIRGRLVSLKEAFIVLGILLGFAGSAVFEHSLSRGDAWRAIWAPPLPVALVVVLGMWASPQSPRWLLLRAAATAESRSSGRHAALGALSRLRRGATHAELHAEIAEIEETLHGLTASVKDDRRTSAGDGCADVLRARRALTAGLGLVALQQLTGQPSVLYYQEAIFRDAGFGAHAASASVVVGAAKFVATLATVASVDRFGRRPLLLSGITLMLAALVLLGSAFLAGDTNPATGAVVLPPGWALVVVGALVAYVSGYQLGFGPVTWLLISEIFPLRLRTAALSLAVVCNFALNLAVAVTLDPLQQAYNALSHGQGQAYLFFTYGVVCLVSLGFVWLYVPETKGKSLEDIEAMLRGR